MRLPAIVNTMKNMEHPESVTTTKFSDIIAKIEESNQKLSKDSISVVQETVKKTSEVQAESTKKVSASFDVNIEKTNLLTTGIEQLASTVKNLKTSIDKQFGYQKKRDSLLLKLRSKKEKYKKVAEKAIKPTPKLEPVQKQTSSTMSNIALGASSLAVPSMMAAMPQAATTSSGGLLSGLFDLAQYKSAYDTVKGGAKSILGKIGFGSKLTTVAEGAAPLVGAEAKAGVAGTEALASGASKIPMMAKVLPSLGTTGKFAGKGVSKLIPGVGLGISLYDAKKRYEAGDKSGAFVSTLGGAVSMVPGVGTAAGLGVMGGQYVDESLGVGKYWGQKLWEATGNQAEVDKLSSEPVFKSKEVQQKMQDVNFKLQMQGKPPKYDLETGKIINGYKDATGKPSFLSLGVKSNLARQLPANFRTRQNFGDIKGGQQLSEMGSYTPQEAEQVKMLKTSGANTSANIAGGMSEETKAKITEQANKYGLDPKMMLSIAAMESGGNKNAISSTGAIGTFQMTGRTATGLGITDRFNEDQNIEGAMKLAQQNAEYLKANGIANPTASNLYMAHQLGPSAALEVIKGAETGKTKSQLSASTQQAMNLNYGSKSATAADYIKTNENALSTRLASVVPSDTGINKPTAIAQAKPKVEAAPEPEQKSAMIAKTKEQVATTNKNETASTSIIAPTIMNGSMASAGASVGLTAPMNTRNPDSSIRRLTDGQMSYTMS